MPSSRAFLLSPAFCGGRRARMLIAPKGPGLMAARLDRGALTIGDAFAFLSGLYFRGKLAYARAFAAIGSGAEAWVITPTRGLQPLDLVLTRSLIEEFASLDVAAGDPRYRVPLERDARALAESLRPPGHVVLLGSIATDKYVDVLASVFAGRLLYPADFVGRGDMSRGALMLRSAAEMRELAYVPVTDGTSRRGPRAVSIHASRT